jgi:hypothetical protein
MELEAWDVLFAFIRNVHTRDDVTPFDEVATYAPIAAAYIQDPLAFERTPPVPLEDGLYHLSFFRSVKVFDRPLTQDTIQHNEIPSLRTCGPLLNLFTTESAQSDG